MLTQEDGKDYEFGKKLLDGGAPFWGCPSGC
jgi:hypothetical protein